MTEELTCRSRAVRAMVLLHDQHLRRFVAVWKEAKAAGVVLPPTSDPSYASMEALLYHGLRAARGYMVWMCEMLQLPDPQIDMPPDAAALPPQVDAYLNYVLDRWRAPLANVADDQLEAPEYPSRWKTKYCIDAMLEHAVMHPIRHTFQLEELIRKKPTPTA